MRTVEFYVDNPAVTTYHYVTFVVDQECVARYISVQHNMFSVHSDSAVYIYRGSVTAWAESNNMYAVLGLRHIGAAPAMPANLCYNMYVVLKPGTYTFGIYQTTDVQYLHAVLHIE